MNNTIVLKNVFVHQQENLILANLNLEIKAGELVYLIGKTGSGKSSLFRVLYGDIPIKQGEAQIAGFDLNKLSKKDIPLLRRKLGIVFQDFKLLQDRTVNQNLSFVLEATGWENKNEIDLHIREVLDKVGIGTKGNKLPHELSGGEQQRVAIARAIINNPMVLLADEPTGNLDPITSVEILNLLQSIAKSGCTVIMASHDVFSMQKMPARTLKCENGILQEIN